MPSMLSSSSRPPLECGYSRLVACVRQCDGSLPPLHHESETMKKKNKKAEALAGKGKVAQKAAGQGSRRSTAQAKASPADAKTPGAITPRPGSSGEAANNKHRNSDKPSDKPTGDKRARGKTARGKPKSVAPRLAEQGGSSSTVKSPLSLARPLPPRDFSHEPRSLAKADVSKFDPNGAGVIDAGIFGLNFTAEESSIVLVPVPWEATTSYGRGTVNGPRAILEASPQLDLFDASLAEQGLSRPWEFGIHMEEIPEKLLRLNAKASELALPIIATGGKISSKRQREALEKVNALSVRVNDWVYERAATWLASDKIVGLVGGDHSVSYGAIKACAERHPGLGILHVDAHADLRQAYEGFRFSHASIMYNVLEDVPGVARLVQVGIRDFCDSEFDITQNDARVDTHFDHRIKRDLLSGRTWSALVDDMLDSMPREVYISFDIDGLEPWLCPGTGTPVPGGLSFEQAVFLLEALPRHGKVVVGFDLNEVAPPGKGKAKPRRSDEWDGNVGARLLYKLCGVALLTNGARTR